MRRTRLGGRRDGRGDACAGADETRRYEKEQSEEGAQRTGAAVYSSEQQPRAAAAWRRSGDMIHTRFGHKKKTSQKRGGDEARSHVPSQPASWHGGRLEQAHIWPAESDAKGRNDWARASRAPPPEHTNQKRLRHDGQVRHAGRWRPHASLSSARPKQPVRSRRAVVQRHASRCTGTSYSSKHAASTQQARSKHAASMQGMFRVQDEDEPPVPTGPQPSVCRLVSPCLLSSHRAQRYVRWSGWRCWGLYFWTGARATTQIGVLLK